MSDNNTISIEQWIAGIPGVVDPGALQRFADRAHGLLRAIELTKQNAPGQQVFVRRHLGYLVKVFAGTFTLPGDGR